MREITPVAKFTKSAKHQDVLTSANHQMREEIGDQVLTEPHLMMLKQKYGIIPPTFSGWELNTVLKGERKAA